MVFKHFVLIQASYNDKYNHGIEYNYALAVQVEMKFLCIRIDRTVQF